MTVTESSSQATRHTTINASFGSNLRGNIIGKGILPPQNSKAYIILNKHTRKVEESLNVTFDETPTPPPSKTSPLVDDNLDEDEAIKELVPQTMNMTIIGTKLDENGIVARNNARLVSQGYNQLEDIDYDETYAPVARLESIRILLAYACALDFKLFQMDVKSILHKFLTYLVRVRVSLLTSGHLMSWHYGIPTNGPYQTNPLSPDDIISSIQIDREGQVRRIRHEEEIDVHEYQILTREIVPTLKPLEEIIRKGFLVGG
ncbi:copia protein [Tanacetum coccineum]|uniref:Copia protein n=1 Tax=Tanacetum coccineum TaxID=301880 RepID=A0ABQ4Z1L6_9ASTR